MSVVVIRDRAKPLVLWRRLEPIPVEWNISNRGSLGRVARRSDGGWVVAGYEASRWFSIGGLPTRVQPSCSSRHSLPLAADAAALPAVSRLACLFDAASDAYTISRGSLCQLLAIACIAACHVTSYPCVGVRPPGPRKLSSTSTVSPQTIWWFQRCPLTIPSVPMTLSSSSPWAPARVAWTRLS